MPTKPASSSTCRCRLRLPSVRPHNAFKSPNTSPLGCATSDVSTPRRAFSWITRSSPSYAKRLFCSLLAGIAPPNATVKHGGNQELSNPERQAHGPRRQRMLAVREREACQAGEEVPCAPGTHRRRQRVTGRKDAEAEHDLPQAGQHPQTLRRKVEQDER